MCRIPSFLGFAAFVLDVIFLEETYPPVILVRKATEIRRRTMNWGVHARQEEIEIDLQELLSKNFSRPLRLLVTEPIILAVSIYISFVYGLLYLSLGAYSLVFRGVYGMRPGVDGLPYFGMLFGMVAAGLYIWSGQKAYVRKLIANNGQVVPEWRLPPAIVGGVVFSIGLFWFGWSGYRADVHWIAPTLAGSFIGFGILSLFIQFLTYLVDAYTVFAASAIAANTLLRSVAGGCFPLFTRQMFDNLGIQWASTLLGCLALVMCPIPVLFYRYGHILRERSKFAPTSPPAPPPEPTTDGEEKEVDSSTPPGVVSEEKISGGNEKASDMV